MPTDQTNSAGQYNDFNVVPSEIEEIDRQLGVIIDRVAKTPDDLSEVSTSMSKNYPVMADYAVNKVIKAQEMANLASEIYSDLWKYRQWLSEALTRLQNMDNQWAAENDDQLGPGGDVSPVPDGGSTSPEVPSWDTSPAPIDTITPSDLTITPVPSPSVTPTPTPTKTPTLTQTPTPTKTATVTPTITTDDVNPIKTPTVTSTISKVPSITKTPTPTRTSLVDPTLSSQSTFSSMGPEYSSLATLSTLSNGDGTDGGKIKGGSSLDGKSSLLNALQRGTSKLASRLSPTGGLAGQKSFASASLAGAGLALGAAGIAGGLLLAGKSGYYTFTPEDWEETEDQVKANIEENFKRFGMTDEEFEAFKVSTYRIKSSELNGHIKKVEKAFSISEGIVDEFINQYHYSIFDEDDEVDKYLLFLTMAIDGMNTTDEVNIYNILNPYFEDEDDVDFIYTGIILDEYLYDEEYEEVEESEENNDVVEYEE